jgi:hypothetical protein
MVDITEYKPFIFRTSGSHSSGYDEFYLLRYKLVCLIFDPEVGGDMFLRNIG